MVFNFSKYTVILRCKQVHKIICIPESFNTNISLQLFNYKITLVYSQHWNANSKDDN